MKHVRWMVLFGLCLVALSAAFYLLQILIFRRGEDTLFYLLQDIAFLPVQVLLVTLILDGLLAVREKRAKLYKLNMVIGTFYSEVGAGLLKALSSFDARAADLHRVLLVRKEWSASQFAEAEARVRGYGADIRAQKGDLKALRGFLLGKREFLLRLLENPNLLEHDAFTDLLWAVFHLTDELAHRADVSRLPEPDCKHLAGDIERAHKLVVIQWLAYMQHLQKAYPYLFSLALRTNPFDPDAQAELK